MSAVCKNDILSSPGVPNRDIGGGCLSKMESVTSLFVNKLKQDDRVPVLSTEFMDYHVNFFAPNYLFFLQIGLVSSSHCLVGI